MSAQWLGDYVNMDEIPDDDDDDCGDPKFAWVWTMILNTWLGCIKTKKR